MTTYDFILQTVQSDGPCSLKHVLSDCKEQGFTKGFIPAYHALKMDNLIREYLEGSDAIVYLV